MNITQMQQISNSFQSARKTTSSQTSVQIATEGKISSVIFDTTKDCDVRKDKESSIVYSKKLNIEEISTDSGIDKLSPSDYVATTLSGDDVASFDAEETPFDQAINRIKEQRASTKDSVDRQVQKRRQTDEDLEQSAEISAASEHLAMSQIPVTKENILRVVGAVDMSVSITSLSLSHCANLVQAGTPITPEKISENQCELPETSELDSVFSELTPQIEKALTQSGMTVDDEVMEQAKYLFENQLPVNRENIEMLQEITEIGKLSKEQMAGRIVGAMLDGYAPEQADLSVISLSEAQSQREQLLASTEEEIGRVYTEPADRITAKRQLEEIRLQMSVGAARQLSKQGIKIDISHLSDIVEGLKEQEKQAASEALSQQQVPATADNVKDYLNIIKVKDQIQNAFAGTLSATLETGMSQTVSEFNDTSKALTANIADTYEKVGTQVRTDLGDSINKAFGNVIDRLEELQMPATKMNQRAVRILGYNQMDITRDNVAKVKGFDTRVNQMLQQMKPAAVAEMVSRKINPLDMTMEELGQTLADISDEVEATDVSYEKYIYKMDHQGQLTSEERKGMIGIYRLLHQVDKSDGAVIGSLIRDGRELTLGSLLSEVRNQKAKGIDTAIDDDFGGLIEAKTGSESISDQIGEAYGTEIVHSLKKHLSPDVLAGQEDSLSEIPLSVLNEACVADTTGDAEYYEEIATRIRSVMSDSADSEQFLEELEMPVTLENIAMAKRFLRGESSAFGDMWTEKESQDVITQMDTEETLNQTLDEVSEEVSDRLTDQLTTSEKNGSVALSQIQTLTLMSQSISFYTQLRKRQIYEIPIATEAGVTTMNVTLEKGTKEQSNVKISMNSERLGQCSATFTLQDKVLSGYLTGNLENPGEWIDELTEELSAAGFEVSDMNYASGIRGNQLPKEQIEKTDTKDLYQVAKIFVMNIQRREEAYEN